MATFTITIRKTNKEGWFIPSVRDSFVAQKQTRAWVKNTYGENSLEYREGYEFYYVKKPNRFGVIWVTKRPNRAVYDISTNGKGERLPFFASDSDYIVTKN